jgi:hypothetical protein
VCIKHADHTREDVLAEIDVESGLYPSPDIAKAIRDYYDFGGWDRVANDIRHKDEAEKQADEIVFGHNWMPDGIFGVQFDPTPLQLYYSPPDEARQNNQRMQEDIWRRRFGGLAARGNPIQAASSYITARYSRIDDDMPWACIRPMEEGSFVPPDVLDDLRRNLEYCMLSNVWAMGPSVTTYEPPIPTLWQRFVVGFRALRRDLAELAYEMISGREFPGDDALEDR